MRRTEAREAVRMAMFLNLLHRWESAELNQAEAAELLGVTERTFRRWTRRYEDDGETGLLDRRLGKSSGKRVPAGRAAEVERLYRERYHGFTEERADRAIRQTSPQPAGPGGAGCSGAVNAQKRLWRDRG